MPYDRKVIQNLFIRALNKLDISSEKYQDAFVLNDTERELDEEFIDLLGWTALSVQRLEEALQKRVYKINSIYWEKFFKNQTDEFLHKLIKEALKEFDTREARSIKS